MKERLERLYDNVVRGLTDQAMAPVQSKVLHWSLVTRLTILDESIEAA